MKRTIAAAALFLAACATSAHELRPAYLELREGGAGEISVLWKTPMRGDLRLALAPEFSGRTEELTPIVTRRTGEAAVQTWRLRALEPLRGQSVRIGGLEGTMTDALVRVEFADGTEWLRRLTPAEPAATIPAAQTGWAVAGEYVMLGVGHILLGIDHLLFVLALLLIVSGWKRLVATVTAFTLAHSITLAAAALGLVHVPQRPVEAVIALSIAYVAWEIVRMRRGAASESLSARAPWVVALAFGLLHGFGFAGALAEVGMPPGRIPLALLAFNVGVELGQLMFIAAVLGIIALWRRVPLSLPRWMEFVPPYAIGSVAMFWVIQRVAVF
ncbi:MAG: HupE/UreJ family protein [Burkholderiales bacterium]